MPKRIQRKRSKGWRMPEGAVYVGRPTQYGNPYVFGGHNNVDDQPIETRQQAVELYRKYVIAKTTPQLIEEMKADLRGKDLACWCPLDQPCHADVLLEIANG